MRTAEVFIFGEFAGTLTEMPNNEYVFQYNKNYQGEPISLTMPLSDKPYKFNCFPPFFDGLLPEGIQLEGLLRVKKIDKFDYFSQICAVGDDLIGAVTVKEIK